MNKQFLIRFVLMLGIGQNVFSQTVIPHDIPCFDITPDNVDTLPSGIHALDCITADGTTIDFNADQNYSIRAGEYIQFDENTVIIPDASHTFHAYIQKEDLDLAWYYPNATPGTVGRYEKLEIGVHFTDSTIQNKIENFVRNQAGDKLNPFNPEDIDLYAEFWVLIPEPLGDGEVWAGAKRVNGFYYEEFERSADTIHWDTIPTPDNFRIRYAPPFPGLWRCKVSAVVAGYGTLTVSEFTFDCVGSDNKGFVRVGDNGRYLRVGDEPFFPVGQNLTGPNNAANQIEWTNTSASPTDYVRFHGTMTELADNGANYFRYLVSPWQTEIEFEHLGNYSNRMTNAWEFDKILDTVKALGLKMHYNMQIHYAFEAPNGFAMTNWDWSARGDSLNNVPECILETDSGYCYRNELDLVNPLDFLTNADAQKYYKQRLRYMVARWGYSTEIAVMELLSEASAIGHETILEYNDEGGTWGCRRQEDTEGITDHPYQDEPATTIPILKAWQTEMLRYIKEDLGQYEHPLAVSYAGLPDFAEGDTIYRYEYVDIATSNAYGLALDKAELAAELLRERIHKDTSIAYANKPFMHSEYGENAGTYTCDHNAGFIKRVKLTPFTGLAGVGLTWDSQLNEQDAWQYFEVTKDFFEGIPLDEEFWFAPEPRVLEDKTVEFFSLRKGSTGAGSKVIGALSNRTFNYWSQGDDTLGCSAYENEPDLIYREATSRTNADFDEDFLTLEYMGSNQEYQIEWINALTGAVSPTSYESSNLFGKLTITFPYTLTGSNVSPIYYFKLYPAGGTFLAPIVPDEEATYFNEFFQKDDLPIEIEPTDWSNVKQLAPPTESTVTVWPNPTQNQLSVSVEADSFTSVSWRLEDAQGRMMEKKAEQAPNFIIDLSVYSDGIYYLTLITDETMDNNAVINQNQVFKVIKQ